MNDFLQNNRFWLRIVFVIAYMAILFLPGYIFFSQRGGWESFQTDSFKTFAALTFPLFGLYAFTLVWMQTLIGMNMFAFSRLFGNAVAFHRTQGLFALLLATTHVFAVQYIFGLQQYIGFKFLAEDSRIFAFFGATAFYLLILTVVVALLRRARPLRKIWRYIHWANYLIFVLVFVHSRNLGSDIEGTLLNYLWYFFAVTFLFSLLGRIVRGVSSRRPIPQTNTPTASAH